MDTTDLGTPETSSDGDEMHLGVEEGTLDGNLNFLANLDTNTNVTLTVTASNDSLESGSLTGLGLLLNGQDAHNLILKFGLGLLDKEVDDLVLLDGDGVGVNFLEGGNLSVFDETSELGEGVPLFRAAATGSTESTSTATTTAASSSTSAPTGTKSSTGACISRSSCSWSFHNCY